MRPCDGFVKRLVIYLASVFFLAVGFGPAALAIDNTVTAQVCQSGATGSITLTQPVSDSVVTQPGVSVEGNVSLVSQVEIYVNNQYVKTVAVALGSTSFQTTVNLAPGTVTIRAQGNSLCGGLVTSSGVVVTYTAPNPPDDPPKPPKPGTPGQPRPPATSPPSIGSQTPTVINPELPGSGGGFVVSSPDDDKKDDDSKGESDSDGKNFWQMIGVAGLFDWLGRVLDIRVTSVDSSPKGFDWIKLILILLGIIALVFGRWLFWFSGAIRDMADRQKLILDIGIRLAGLVAIIIALVLL